MMNIRTSFFMWSPPRDLNHLYVMKYVLTRHGRKYILRCIPVDAEIAGRQIPRLDSLLQPRNVVPHQPPRIFQRQRRYRPDALPFEQFVSALDPPVRLREERRGTTCVIPEVRMNCLKSSAMNCGPLADHSERAAFVL
jgi:hypothetical protein